VELADRDEDVSGRSRVDTETTPWYASREFLLIFSLFVAFRIMALLAYRPGGQVLDFSDFYWYREYAQVTRQGYFPYVNLWAPYPPLFPILVVGLWWVSTLMPPWEHVNLWFTLSLGGTMLVFEAGNLVLLFCIARRLADRRRALRSAWFYTALFVPVYTLTAHFESLPLFFFLLGLYLLLKQRPYWSAAVTGIGFLTKLIPLILLPVGARLPRAVGEDGAAGGSPLWRLRIETRWMKLGLDLKHLLLYVGTFAATILLFGLPLYLLNSRLVWASLAINQVREPWQTVWALIEGNYRYGIAPLDMRDLDWRPVASSGEAVPWLVVTALFGLVYGFVYTRKFDWRQPKNIVAFTGFTVLLFMLYSKGYSPQWLGWALIFVALLLPNLRGAFYAIVVSLVNLLEANVFFTMVPGEHWLLAVTVSIRTFVFLMLVVEFLLILQPQWSISVVQKARRWVLVVFAAALAVGGIFGAVRLGQAYADVRLEASPYRDAIEILQEEASAGAAILVNSYDHRTYDWLYPYLWRRLSFYMLDDYAPSSSSVEDKTLSLLDTVSRRHQEWWMFDNDPEAQSASEAILSEWLNAHGEEVLVHDVGGGRLSEWVMRP
jgi:hypothetical protein